MPSIGGGCKERNDVFPGPDRRRGPQVSPPFAAASFRRLARVVPPNVRLCGPIEGLDR